MIYLRDRRFDHLIMEWISYYGRNLPIVVGFIPSG
jgi:hypothetical protein